MVQKHIVISMIAPVAVVGILIMAILAATVNAQESNSTENGQESNNTGNAQQATSTGMPENATSPSGSMENTTSGRESNNTGNVQETNSNMTEAAPSNMTAAAPNIGNAQQENNNTGNVTSSGVPNLPSLENATSTGAPENATSPSGSTTNNTASPESMVNSSTGNVQQSNNTGNGPTSQESSNTRNARQENNGTENAISGVPCPYNANITCAPPTAPLNGTNTNTTSTPYVVNKNSSAYLVGYNDAFSYNTADTCSALSNTSSVQNDCGSGYVDGINKLGDPTFQQSADFVKGMLAAHNRERHLVGVTNDLVWDKELAASAKVWAEHLSPAGELIHDYGNVVAENIASDLANGPTAWINEKNDYHDGTCASGKVCGHYLNMVDPRLTAVGCGTASNPHDIVVCRYR
ncbi:MAG: CAP domain-containing protein [Candidatus Nitrosopolaris sp.]